MTIDMTGLGKAYLFGLTLSLTIGPMALLIVQRCVSRSTESGFRTAYGIATADFTYGLIAFLVGSPVLRILEHYSQVVHAIASTVLLAMAFSIAIGSMRTFANGKSLPAAAAHGNDFFSAYALTMVNPSTIVVLLGFLGSLPFPAGNGSALFLTIGFFLGSLTGQCLIATMATVVRGFFRNPANLLLLNLGSAVGIAFFGVAGLIGVFR